MRCRTANCLRTLLAGTIATVLLTTPGVRGQIQIKIGANGKLIPADAGSDPSLQPRADIDKDLSKAMRKAEEYRDRGEFENAVEIVQRYILSQKVDRDGKPSADRSADYFTDQTMKISLKRQALKLIGGLPEEGRRLYELKFGDEARSMLKAAIATNDMTQLEIVTRQFFHTKAGYEAAYLMGTHKLDQGETLAAAMHFEQLRRLPEASRKFEPALSLKSAVAWYRVGEIDRAVEIVTALKQATADGRLSLGARTIRLFVKDNEAEGWLARLVGQPLGVAQAGTQQWAMFRGNASRNAGGSPSSPAWDSAWEFTTIRDAEALLEDPKRLEEINAKLRQMETDKQRSGMITMPAAHPLILGDAVVFRTLRNIRAVHLKTGELLWETAMISPSYEKLVATDSPEGNVRINQMQATALETLLAQRAWRDLTAGTLSSDGRYIFALDGMGFLSSNQQMNFGRRMPNAPSESSKLVAYDLAADGKLVWEVGGPREYGFEMAGTFFLGPPLPLDGHLYCIAEVTGDVRLVVLNAQSGQLEWSQTLALPTAALMQFPLRRLAGLTPAYSDGVLICPTTSGAVVAVDPARRILLWGQRYSRSGPTTPTDPRQLMMMRARGMLLTSGKDDEDRWVDAAPTIADGRILLTPRDSDDLICLKLVDGSVAWKKSRGQALYLAAVYEGKVILVGRSQIEALSLRTGKPVWREPIAIESPSGRGVRDGRFYRVPLSSGEIASVDLKLGKLIARSTSRSGEVLGNLAVADGTIVSQSIDKIVGFKSLGELQQLTDGVLAKNPNDAAALALRGEMRLHNGDEERGMADLRKAIDIDIEATPRARSLVVASLLEGLRHDFPKYRPMAAEIERLVNDPKQRGQYLRLHAAGLHELGDQQAAFREYLKIAGSDTGKPVLERVNSTLSVRSDRWIRPRISQVYRKSEGAERKELDRAIAELLDNAVEKPDEIKPLYRFLDAFIDLPMGERAIQLLANRLGGDARALEQELLLRRLRRSTDRSHAGFATAKLAALYIHHKRGSAAAAMLNELATQWNDTVCLDEKTGRQLVEEWRAAEDVAKLLEEQANWPAAKIVAKKETRRRAVARNYPVRILGPRGPLGEGWTLLLDARRQNLIARDESGRELWKLATGGLKTMIPNQYGNYARVNGHLLIVVFGTHFVVLDGFQNQKSGPRILWQSRLVEAINGNSRNTRVQLRQVIRPGGLRVMTVQDQFGRPIGKVVPIDDSLICYQVGTKLVAADPLTGETLWERRSVSRGSEIFGDREFVFVVAPNKKEAMTLRAADGEQVATRPLPTEGTRLSTQGRHIIVWTGRALQKFDVWTGKNVWEKRMPPASKAVALDSFEEAVAVLNPHQGSFAIVSTDDGRLLVDSSIEADAAIDSFVVHRSQGQYVLLTHRPSKRANGAQVFALYYNNPLVNGFVYGFDRKTGRKVWTTQVTDQAFDIDQPAGVPVLVFAARRISRPQKQGRVVNRYEYAITVIDKRNGRNVYESAGTQSLSQFDVTADLTKKTIAINFSTSALHLSMTKEPLAEPLQAKRATDEK